MSHGVPKPRPEAGEGALDEEKIHGRPDYWSRQKTRSRDARQGTFPGAWSDPTDSLSLEEKIQRHGCS